MVDNEKMKINDIYQWRHPSQETDIKRRSGTAYWACAQIAIFDGARLLDMYSMHVREGEFETQYGDHRAVPLDGQETLEYLGNLDEYDWKGHYSTYGDYSSRYSQDDILNLAHPNQTRGMLFLRKGAAENNEVRIKYLHDQVEKNKSKISSLKRSMQMDLNEIQSLTREATECQDSC